MVSFCIFRYEENVCESAAAEAEKTEQDTSSNNPQPSQCPTEQHLQESDALTENDIDGAKLSKDPKASTIQELKWWLQCRDKLIKGLKTKAQLVNRVQEVMNSSENVKIVDPSAHQSYLAAKRRKIAITETRDANCADDIVLPSTGWKSEFEEFPDFTDVAIRSFTSRTGKQKKGKTCEKPEKRGYSFFVENYVKDYMLCRKEYFFIKAKCFLSQGRKADPHQLWMAIGLEAPHHVKKAYCTCRAGANGYCNHALALMHQTRHISELQLKSAPETMSKTSQPQEWHKPDRMQGINAQPIMDVTVFRTCSDGAKGARCTLYDACKKHTNEAEKLAEAKEQMSAINPKFGFSAMAQVEDDSTEYVGTRLPRITVPKGSPLSYQLSALEANTDTTSIDTAQFNLHVCEATGCPDKEHGQTFPMLPLTICPIMQNERHPVLEKVSVNKDEIQDIEESTRQQRKCQRWYDEKKFRITASTFPQVVKRKTTNHGKFIQNLISKGKNTSAGTEVHKSSLKHGIDNEDKAVEKYSRYMSGINHPVKIFQSGLVINPTHPQYGCSPDRKVFDSAVHPHFGIAEVKCPYTLRNLTPLQAAQYGDNKFPLELIDGKLQLKQDHDHMIQIQTQMALTCTKWCDYIVYTFPGLHIQRIFFNQNMWTNEILPKVDAFYFDHYAPKLAEIMM